MKPTFHNLTIKKINKETVDTVSITFDTPNGLKEQYAFKAGQYLTLKALINGEDVRRSYSISSSVAQNELRVAVKQVENGTFSTYANQELKEGDQMDVMTPEGGFTVSPKANESKNYVFFAAGSGITPVLSMIRTILETDPSSSIYLYYGNKTAAETIYKGELDALNSANDNLNLTYVLSREDSGTPNNNGRIDANKCAHFFNEDLADLKLEGIYACGPSEMIDCVKEFYTSKGLLHKVHFELFTVPQAAANESAEVADDGVSVDAEVTVIIDDEEYAFPLSTDGKDVLSAAQDADADVPFSCKGGVCCTCRAKVLEGSVKMSLNFALEEEEVEEGFVLTCQAHPTSDKVVISFDEY